MGVIGLVEQVSKKWTRLPLNMNPCNDDCFSEAALVLGSTWRAHPAGTAPAQRQESQLESLAQGSPPGDWHPQLERAPGEPPRDRLQTWHGAKAKGAKFILSGGGGRCDRSL